MKTYFYIALGALIASVVAFGLAFVPILGVYSLIAAVLLQITSLSFLSTQKKKEDFKGVKYLSVAAYILLGVTVAFFVGGLVYSSLNV